MSCDFETLYYNVKQELLEVFKEAENPVPRVKIKDLKTARICGLANLAKVLLYLEVFGVVVVANKEAHYQNWEIEIQAQVLDILLEQL